MFIRKVAPAWSKRSCRFFVNGSKISELHLNGDNQKVKIPPMLVYNGKNELTIKTGHNMMETAYIDYDDIEFMNLFIEN